MRRAAILIFCLVLAACAKVETSSLENVRTDSNKAVKATPEQAVALKPVVPSVKLSLSQQKFLDKSLPPEVREILEKAETFEVLAELGKQNSEGDLLQFKPNVSAKIDGENIEKCFWKPFTSTLRQMRTRQAVMNRATDFMQFMKGKRLTLKFVSRVQNSI